VEIRGNFKARYQEVLLAAENSISIGRYEKHFRPHTAVFGSWCLTSKASGLSVGLSASSSGDFFSRRPRGGFPTSAWPTKSSRGIVDDRVRTTCHRRRQASNNLSCASNLLRLAAFEAGQPQTHVETPLRRYRASQRLHNITTIFSLRLLGYAFGMFHRHFLGWWELMWN
jgi:hypothetical protein